MKAQRLKELGASVVTELATVRATIVGWEPGKGILVELGKGEGPVEIVLAQTVVRLTGPELDQAAAERRPALVVFEDGDRRRPVVVGLLAPVPAAAPAAQTEQLSREALLADQTVIIRGRDSVELRCGEASITLHSDGRILIRGTNVISRASEQNRVVGGSLHFN